MAEQNGARRGAGHQLAGDSRAIAVFPVLGIDRPHDGVIAMFLKSHLPHQVVECPVGRAEIGHAHAGRLKHDFVRATEFIGHPLGRETRQRRMRPRVVGNLMPLGNDTAGNFRMSFNIATNDIKRRFDIFFGQHIQ
ncbi:MAG: hypothetical protein O3A75_03475 [Verrucomicrobia bacterium]|nr:hypothetical protein [Verrucomicrobiota bacterium]